MDRAGAFPPSRIAVLRGHGKEGLRHRGEPLGMYSGHSSITLLAGPTVKLLLYYFTMKLLCVL